MSWATPRTMAMALAVPVAVLLLRAFGPPRESEQARPPAASLPETLLHVPRASAEVSPDGVLDDVAWLHAAARTGVFVGADGAPGRPHAEARIVYGADDLYVALYAADRDIRASRAALDGPRWLGGDVFELVFASDDGERRIEVSPDGKITDARRGPAGWDYGWQSGARVGHDVDGTVDDPTDEDEEWVLELAIPLASLGLAPRHGARVGLSLRRCDWEKDGSRTCTSWGEVGARGVLELE